MVSNLEKVIDALTRCIADETDCYNGCPYFCEADCMNSAIRDALELLKEQEPRVLTWEEVKKAEVCWLEERGYEPFATLEADTWNSEKYGKSYRCWNRMPTDEQRKAVKWEND